MPTRPASHKPHTRNTKLHLAQPRASSTARGYNYRWQRAREQWLRHHPICVHCEQAGIFNPATDVDHIEPHRGDQKKFWDRTNWQSLCASHHSAKTARGQ